MHGLGEPKVTSILVVLFAIAVWVGVLNQFKLRGRNLLSLVV